MSVREKSGAGEPAALAGKASASASTATQRTTAIPPRGNPSPLAFTAGRIRMAGYISYANRTSASEGLHGGVRARGNLFIERRASLEDCAPGGHTGDVG